MLVIVFVLTVLGTGIAEDGPAGYLFYTASVINLDLNEASYMVGCSLNGTTEEDANSRHLVITNMKSAPYETKVINDTTIAHEVNLRVSDESTICGSKSYVCRLNRTFIGMKTIYVARPPPRIKPSDFKCISHNRKYLTCEFKRQDSCNLYSEYKLFMNRLGQPTDCDLTVNDSTLSFNSKSETCLFSSGHKSISFLIVGENIVGKTETQITVDHYDIVRPAAPSNLKVSSVDNTSVEATWEISIMLLNLDRVTEFEFLMISKYGNSSSFKNMTFEKGVPMVHKFSGLYAFTDYELKIRVRVVPRSVRNFEEEYWSDWSSVRVRTQACRPYQAPRTAPGAYSFRERGEKLATVDVHWELVPEYLHNGPGFGYDVFAVAESGQRLNASHPVQPNGVTKFQNLKADERYIVHLSSYNDEGRSENNSYILIYPKKDAYDPKIKRVLFNDSYHLQWFSADKPEHISNYTVMYCTFSATGSCQNSIHIVTLPPNATSYSIHSTKPLNFALAANYQFYSSELSWMQCIVPTSSNLSRLTFNLTDVTEHSVTLRLSLSCTDKSLVERYEVRYWPKMDKSLEKNMTKQSYETVIKIDDLKTDTDYVVNVTAYDENGIPYRDIQTVHTSDRDILLQLISLLLFGILAMAIITTSATRRVKKIMDIKVEIPLGLEEILDMPTNSAQSGEPYHVYEEIEPTMLFSELLEKDELLPMSLYDQVDQDDTMKLVTMESISYQPVEVIHDEHRCLPEHSQKRKPYDQDDPDPDRVQPRTIKSILKKPDEAIQDKQACLSEEGLEKPKPSVQIVAGTNYIQPVQMKVKQDLSGNRLSSSSGYVDVNLIMKQQMIR